MKRMLVITPALFSVASVVLWLVYPMGTMVENGMYSISTAISSVLRMGLITAILSIVGMAALRLMMTLKSSGGIALRDASGTGVMLAAYTVLNVIWRERWQPGSGGSPFLPPWSELNARFFYEYNWLSYLLFVAPLMMLATGICSMLATKMHSIDSGKPQR